MFSIAENINQIKKQIATAAKNSQRQPSEISLLAVSKQQSIEKILAAYSAGQRKFAENYLQEALKKIAALSDYDDIEWHFIGNIQANKTKKIAENFAWVQSVSREKIAKRLNAYRPAHWPPLNVCIEVNIGDEPSKSGVSPSELSILADAIMKMDKLRLRGLMALPVMTQDINIQTELFAQVAELQQQLIQQGFPLDTLSLGTSQDYIVAIAAGSTMLRVGTAIFGRRDK